MIVIKFCSVTRIALHDKQLSHILCVTLFQLPTCAAVSLLWKHGSIFRAIDIKWICLVEEFPSFLSSFTNIEFP